MATKSAILVLYIRMAAAHPFLRYASYGTLTIVNLAGTVLTFLNIFQCRPIRAAFSDDDGTCIDVVSLYLASAPINVLTDLAILLLPLPILTRLRMEFRQKVALVATFTVGAFVTIVDVVRIAYLQDALREEVLASADTGDDGIASINTQPTNFTYHVSFSLMWSAVEVSVGLMCCCVLVLKPLIMKVIPKLLMARRHSVTYPSNATGREENGNGTKQGESARRMSFLERITQTRSQASTAQIISNFGSAKDDRSPDPNLGTILEDLPVPYPTGEEADGDEDDGGMDFFQMLAADPPTTSTTRPIQSSPGRVAPLALPNMSPILHNTPTMTEASPFEIRESIPPRKVPRRATMLSFNGRPKEKEVNTQAPTQNFFDFVNMNGQKPLTELTAKEAWWPVLFGTYPSFFLIVPTYTDSPSVDFVLPLGFCLRFTGYTQWRDHHSPIDIPSTIDRAT